MRIGFIGLGAMGKGMAGNLLHAGHEVTVFNRTRSRSEELVAEGARIADRPADAGNAEIVITMLADDAAVEQVLFGEGETPRSAGASEPRGLIDSLPRGAVHLSMSTIGVALSERLAVAHRDRGQLYAAAPVFGRPEAAAAAKLFIVAAGDAAALERAQPVLAALGQRTFRIGDRASAANVVKLSGNFLIASVLESLGEALALVRKNGVDPAQYLDIVTGTLFDVPVYRSYGRLIVEGKHEPAGFKARLGLKDVRLALEAADAASVPMPIASLLHDQLLSAVARGHGDRDWSVVGRVVAENAGL